LCNVLCKTVSFASIMSDFASKPLCLSVTGTRLPFVNQLLGELLSYPCHCSRPCNSGPVHVASSQNPGIIWSSSSVFLLVFTGNSKFVPEMLTCSQWPWIRAVEGSPLSPPNLPGTLLQKTLWNHPSPRNWIHLPFAGPPIPCSLLCLSSRPRPQHCYC
jgi:hypothetical protein